MFEQQDRITRMTFAFVDNSVQDCLSFQIQLLKSNIQLKPNSDSLAFNGPVHFLPD